MPRDAEAWLAQQGIEREPLLPQRSRQVDDPHHPARQADAIPHDPDVSKALAFLRRSTAGAPQSEQRLADKLAERGVPDDVIGQAMRVAREQGLVDDPAMVASLIAERRAKGHAVSRIRRDLLARGFERTLVDAGIAPLLTQDQEAMAFDVARQRAEHVVTLDPATAFRRVAGYVARRGYPEGLARKVAREAVYATREDDIVSGH